MIHGIGTDIVKVSRIERLHKLYTQAFADRILTTHERLEWIHSNKPVMYLAKRFAAKEAFSKAMGTGLRSPVTLQNIGIANDTAGKPEFMYAPELKKWMDKQGIGKVHLSISDEEDYVIAYVISEQKA